MWAWLRHWIGRLPTLPYVDNDGWIHGDGVELYPSKRGTPLTTPRGEPLAIIWHYTATAPGTAKSLAERITGLPVGDERSVSWHLLIGVDGVIRQSLPLTWGGWHCSAGRIDGYRVNKCTIGIELEGYGDRSPTAQVDAARHMMRLVHLRYGIARSRLALGHRDYDPDRRDDPGDLWQPILTQLAESVAPLRSV